MAPRFGLKRRLLFLIHSWQCETVDEEDDDQNVGCDDGEVDNLPNPRSALEDDEINERPNHRRARRQWPTQPSEMLHSRRFCQHKAFKVFLRRWDCVGGGEISRAAIG